MPQFIAFSGVPPPTLGANGDDCYNTVAGAVYTKAAGVWGPKFAFSSGNFFRAGAGVPDAALGINGDYYINRINDDLYEKVAGVWILRYTKGGSTAWYSGTGAPTFLGGEGDHYFDTEAGVLYKFTLNAWAAIYTIGGGANAVTASVGGSTYSYALAGKWLVGWEVTGPAAQTVRAGTTPGGDELGEAAIGPGGTWVGQGNMTPTDTPQTVYFSGLTPGANTIKLWLING